MRGLTKILGILLLLFPAAAHSSFLFVGTGKIQVLTDEVSYRMEDGAVRNIDQAISATSGWTSQAEKPYTTPTSVTTVWVKFDLPAAAVSRRILVTTAPWERTDFFVVRDGRVIDHQVAGALVPWAERTTHITMNPVIIHAGFVSVDWAANAKTTVYARLETQSRFISIDRLRFHLWDAEQVLEAERHDRILQGLFYGVMFFLIVYNFGLFMVTREKSFLYYVIMESGYVVAWGVIFGLTFEYLWPSHPEWDYRGLWISTLVGGFGLMQFLRHYLETWKQFPRTDAILKWSAYVSLLSIPEIFLPIDFEYFANIIIYSAPVSVPFLLFMIVRAWLRKHPLAPNLLAAMVCLFAGIVVYMTQEAGLLPRTDLTVHAAQIGSALAGVVLSIGLGLRWQHTRTEVAELQLAEERTRTTHEREKRELVEEHSRGLETKVEERTAELVASQRQSDVLLANILPRAIIDELKANGVTRRHQSCLLTSPVSPRQCRPCRPSDWCRNWMKSFAASTTSSPPTVWKKSRLSATPT